MSQSKFTVSAPAQRVYRVLGGDRPSGEYEAARAAWNKAGRATPAAVHVTRRADGWAVKVEGNARASTIQPTKAKAVAIGKAKAGNQGTRLIEHATDGKIAKNTRPTPKK
jgi:hypothetical protein